MVKTHTSYTGGLGSILHAVQYGHKKKEVLLETQRFKHIWFVLQSLLSRILLLTRVLLTWPQKLSYLLVLCFRFTFYSLGVNLKMSISSKSLNTTVWHLEVLVFLGLFTLKSNLAYIPVLSTHLIPSSWWQLFSVLTFFSIGSSGWEPRTFDFSIQVFYGKDHFNFFYIY